MVQLSTTQPARHPSPRAKASKVAYVRFARPDLKKAEQFFTDFGLTRVGSDAAADTKALYFRAADSAPWCHQIVQADEAQFLGIGFDVASEDELHSLAQLDCAGPIVAVDGPGGGMRVRLAAPGGMEIDVVHGRAEAAPLPVRAPLQANSGGNIARLNEGQRAPNAAPQVMKLGHVALEVAQWQATSAFITEYLGLIPSDAELLPDGSPAICFFRMDLGDAPSDHHAIALAQSFRYGFDHAAYEVVDADAVGLGQKLLRRQGYQHAWGIGRHILGSQIFDYWRDPWGEKFEHYCDGDVFTADHETGFGPAKPGGLAQWGPPLPADFIRPKPSLTLVRQLLHALRNVPDVTVGKLRAILKSAG